MKPFQINQFFWGMSQDDMLYSKGQCIYSHGIDVTRSPSQIKLMNELTRVYTSTVEVCWIFSPEQSTVWFGTSDGKIKDAANGNTIIDTGFSERIIDGCLFLGNFYAFTPFKVFKFTYTAGALSSQSTWLNWTGQYRHPVIFDGWEMYFPTTASTGKNVSYTDSTGVLQTLFTTNFSNNVRALTISGTSLRVYSENLLSIVDLGTKTVTYSQQLPFVVNSAKSDGNVDYVITDNDEMYVLSGLEFKKLSEFYDSNTLGNYISDSNKFTFLSGVQNTTLSVGNGRVYAIDGSSQNKFYIYGKKMEWVPNSFSYWPIHDSSTSAVTTVHSIFAQGNKVYVGYQIGSSYYIGFVNYDPSVTQTCYEGVMIFPEFDAGDYSLIKNLDEIRVGKTGTTGQLWLSIDWGAFTQIDTLNQTEFENKTLNESVKKEFREMALMVKLYSSNDSIKNISVRYSVIDS